MERVVCLIFDFGAFKDPASESGRSESDQEVGKMRDVFCRPLDPLG